MADMMMTKKVTMTSPRMMMMMILLILLLITIVTQQPSSVVVTGFHIIMPSAIRTCKKKSSPCPSRNRYHFYHYFTSSSSSSSSSLSFQPEEKRIPSDHLLMSRQTQHSLSSSSSLVQEEEECENKTTTTALLLLSPNRLRVRDNIALKKAAELYGRDGLLSIGIIWPWPLPKTNDNVLLWEITPVEVFGYAALRALNNTLYSEYGQKISFIIPSSLPTEKDAKEEDYDPISILAKTIIPKLQPTHVLMDLTLMDRHLNYASKLQNQLPPEAAVKVMEVREDDGLLFPFDEVPKALGRSRQGGRSFRWSTFQTNAMKILSQEQQQHEPSIISTLPPPPILKGMDEIIPESTAANIDKIMERFPPWAKQLLIDWGDITEEEAIRRATTAARASIIQEQQHESTASSSESSESPLLTERGSKDTKLSPYLRFGMISPKRAAAAAAAAIASSSKNKATSGGADGDGDGKAGGGVRQRDLLWRDWSHICYHYVKPLQRGEPVLDYMDNKVAVEQQRQQQQHQQHPLLAYDEDESMTLMNEMMKNHAKEEEELLFRLWCVGNTGSQLVDAAMKQLWVEGWIPRKYRLLVASCLVEGLGVNWRYGRDWFKYTLVDHDDAINELMWQNAGFCGVDPFYFGMKWESLPSSNNQEIEDYVKKWTKKTINWPSDLKPYTIPRSKKDMDSLQQQQRIIEDLAESRRIDLHNQGVYKAARNVANCGVRISWPGLGGGGGGSNDDDDDEEAAKSHHDSTTTKTYAVKEGEVMGVGRASVHELNA